MSWKQFAKDPLCAIAEALNNEKPEQSWHQSSAAGKHSTHASGQGMMHAVAAKEAEVEAVTGTAGPVGQPRDEGGVKSMSADKEQHQPLSHPAVDRTEAQAQVSSTLNTAAPTTIIRGAKLYAISDIHLAYKANVAFFDQLTPHPDDGLILAGDVGETADHLELAFSMATRLFKAVWWVPGNHELYSVAGLQATDQERKQIPRGRVKYDECVELARRYAVYTPEDDYVIWQSDEEHQQQQAVICPIFTLYDYSFAPEHITTPEEALEWAKEADVIASDEALLHPDPYASRQEWCHLLVDEFDRKLQLTTSRNPNIPLVIINHWPLRLDTVRLWIVPRFIIWCGTRKTHDWHQRFNAKVVVTGHIHIRRTDWRRHADGHNWTRFEEVSMGYPRHYQDYAHCGGDIDQLLREILPGPQTRPLEDQTVYRTLG